MKTYIDNLLPRLKQFSQSLDRKEIFIDTPWIYVDENNSRHKYIFQRDGSLIMSVNGEVLIGKWEYLSVANSILIDRIRDKILLNQHFIHSSIMILKLDGTSENNLILANELIIPDYNVYDFLKTFYNEKANIKVINLKDGRSLELENNPYGIIANSLATINGDKIEDCILETLENDKKYKIENSQIVRVLIDVIYKTKKGELTIEQEEYGSCYGDRVFYKSLPAPDGIYSMGFLENLYVVDGKLTYKRAYKQKYKL